MLFSLTTRGEVRKQVQIPGLRFNTHGECWNHVLVLILIAWRLSLWKFNSAFRLCNTHDPIIIIIIYINKVLTFSYWLVEKMVLTAEAMDKLYISFLHAQTI